MQDPDDADKRVRAGLHVFGNLIAEQRDEPVDLDAHKQRPDHDRQHETPAKRLLPFDPDAVRRVLQQTASQRQQQRREPERRRKNDLPGGDRGWEEVNECRRQPERPAYRRPPTPE